MKIFILAMSLIMLSCKEEAKITIIKQWHLAPGKDASDVEASKKLPQYLNQVEIYKLLETKIHEKPVIVAEGCEGNLNEEEKFNGWSIIDLKAKVKDPDYVHIMAPVFMKIKAKYPQSTVVCGDKVDDIEKNKLAFSDLRGFAGYYERLIGSKNRPEVFDRYKRSLNELAGKVLADPVEFARKESLKALNRSKNLIHSRNNSFYEVARKHKEKDIYIIIGGIHTEHLSQLFNNDGIAHEVITPKGYSEVDQELYATLEKTLSTKGEKVNVSWMEVPEAFSADKIPLAHLLAPSEVAIPKEWAELTSLMESAGLNPNILLSDFDKDGIRDFTVSTSGALTIISAEDDDWDNDGVLNLVDSTWSDSVFEVKKINKDQISNIFDVQNVSIEKTLSEIQNKGITLLSREGLSHDLLILKIFKDVLSYVKQADVDVRFLRVTKPLFTYGKQVYFSYRPSSQTIDIYLDELVQKFNEMHEKHYSQKTKAELVKGYLLPLLYHSLAHELVHSMDLNIKKIAQSVGWAFEERPTGSKYLTQKRLKRKVIASTFENTSFRGKSVREWIDLYKKGGESFLINEQLPSLYSLEKPSEWVAEAVSMCFIRKVFPKSVSEEGSKGFEKLLGINPSSMDEKFCKDYFSAKN